MTGLKMTGFSITAKGKAWVLLAVQMLLVLSIAGKYLYERKVCPRVWVRSAQYDPSLPLRGRYLGLQLTVNVCGLPHEAKYFAVGYNNQPGYWRWRVVPLAKDGKLTVALAGDSDRPEVTTEVTEWGSRGCERSTLLESVEYFISDAAKSPFPLGKGEDLWVEVTVPPSGPPRPLQLAKAKGGEFRILDLR